MKESLWRLPKISSCKPGLSWEGFEINDDDGDDEDNDDNDSTVDSAAIASVAKELLRPNCPHI